MTIIQDMLAKYGDLSRLQFAFMTSLRYLQVKRMPYYVVAGIIASRGGIFMIMFGIWLIILR